MVVVSPSVFRVLGVGGPWLFLTMDFVFWGPGVVEVKGVGGVGSSSGGGHVV